MKENLNKLDDGNTGCIIIIFILMLFFAFIIGMAIVTRSITTDTPIEPELKLIVIDNKVDTLYIYKENLK